MYICVCMFVCIYICMYVCVYMGRMYGAMGRRIDPSGVDPLSYSCCSQYSTTGVTKAVVCAILSVGWCI